MIPETDSPGQVIVNIQPSDMLSAAEGDDVSFYCVTSLPAVGFEWQFTFSALPSNAVPTTVNNMVSRLDITDVVQGNAGTYMCTASFANGRSQNAFATLSFEGKSIHEMIGCTNY